MTEKLFSIIIPIYNSQEFIMETLDSILDQNDIGNIDYEVICIDDCSTDNTTQIIKKYQKNNKNIKLIINEKNQGCSISRNKGIENAIGRYIIFLDSDDLLDINFLKKISRKIQEDDFELIAFNAYIFNPNGKTNFLKCEHNLNYINQGKNEYLSLITNLWCVVIKKEFLITNNIFFDTKRVFEDWIFLYKVYNKIEKAAFINESLYLYRTGFSNNTLTSNIRNKNSETTLLFKTFYESKNIFSNHKWNKFEYCVLLRANDIFIHFLNANKFSQKEYIEYINFYSVFLNSIPEILFFKLYKNRYGKNTFRLIKLIRNNSKIVYHYNPSIKSNIVIIKKEFKRLCDPLTSIFLIAKNILKIFVKILFSSMFFRKG